MRAVVVAAVVLAGCYDKAAEQPCTLSCEQAPCPGTLVCGADNLCQTAGLPACSMIMGSDGGIDGDGGTGSDLLVTAPNGEPGDLFGTSISVSGDGIWLVVGAPGESSNASGVLTAADADNSLPAAGAVYVYKFNGSKYVFQTYIKSESPDAGDQFGASVSIAPTGNVIAIGAPFEDGGGTNRTGVPTDDSSADTGAVFFYDRTSPVTPWTFRYYVKPPTSTPGQLFGSTVALTADGHAVGVGATGVGHSALMCKPYGTTYLAPGGSIPNGDDADHFGISVAVSRNEDTLLVGEDLEDGSQTGGQVDATSADELAMDSGAVRIYPFQTAQHPYMKASNTGAGDHFGTSVSADLAADSYAIGAPGEDSNGTSQSDDSVTNSGAVYVFTRTGLASWNQSAYVKAPTPTAAAGFGQSVVLTFDAAFLAVGAPGDAGGAGGVYTFDASAPGWTFSRNLVATGGATGDGLGTCLAVSDGHDVVAAGAPHRAGNTGAVYVFR